MEPNSSTDDTRLVFNEPTAMVSFLDVPPEITVHAPSGKTATIAYGGDEVVYSGELPVAESAKVFFDCLRGYYRSCNGLEPGDST